MAGVFYVRDFGAVADGATDDAPAFQAALDAARDNTAAGWGIGGTVYAPAGSYVLKAPLVASSLPGDFRGISLVGDGPYVTRLAYQGPTNQAAVLFDRQKLFRVQGLSLQGPGAATGGLGFRLSGISGSGTVCGSATFEHVLVSGFNVGVQVGGTGPDSGGPQASELLFSHLVLYSNTYGLWAQGFNTLDLTFVMLEMMSNTYGVVARGASNLHVLGGSASLSTEADFDFGAGGCYSLRGFRTESSGRLVGCFGTTIGTVGLTLDACDVRVRAGRNAVSLMGATLASLRGCLLGGPVMRHLFSADQGASLTLENCGIAAPEPFSITGTHEETLRYRVTGCQRLDPDTLFALGAFDDEQGVHRYSTGRRAAWRIGADGVFVHNGASGGTAPHTHPEYALAGHTHLAEPVPPPSDLTLDSLTIGQTTLYERDNFFVAERPGGLLLAFGIPLTEPPPGGDPMALTKVQQVELLAITSTASNVVTVGTPVDVSAYYAADVRIRMGRATSAAFTVGPRVRIEGTYDATSPTAQQWATLAEFQAALGANIGSQAISGTEAAGQTDLTLAAGTNFAAGDYVFIHDNVLASSEWARVVSISGAVITIEEATLNEHDGSDTVRDQAEQYHALLDLTGIQAIRVVIDGSGSGQAVIHEAIMGAVSAL